MKHYFSFINISSSLISSFILTSIVFSIVASIEVFFMDGFNIHDWVFTSIMFFVIFVSELLDSREQPC